MNLIRSFIEYLTTSAEARREARNAAYLSEATDLHDLESRMRELDRNARLSHASWMPF